MLAGFRSAARAQVFRDSAVDLKAVVPAADQAVGPTGYPTNSITLFLLPRG